MWVQPQAVNEWFWVVYADAYEWVELPNVSGMALFADGGLLASKPYAAVVLTLIRCPITVRTVAILRPEKWANACPSIICTGIFYSAKR